MMSRARSVLVMAMFFGMAAVVGRAAPVETAFTYQGTLVDGGEPVTNTSPGCDFEFTLWDDPATAGLVLALGAAGIGGSLLRHRAETGRRRSSPR